MEFPSVNPLVIKKIITEGYTDEMKRVILFFLFLTDKKLPMKDSLTEIFHR